MSLSGMGDRPLRVGIAGARGIGRHQAKWFAHVGCEVASVYGTTAESAAAGAEAVRGLCPFQGRVECEWDAFIAAPDLDAVAVTLHSRYSRSSVGTVWAGEHADDS